MRYEGLFFSLLIVLTWCGCRWTSNESVPRGAYAYTSYDSSGAASVSGWISIQTPDSVTVTGEWHLKAIGDPQRIGPQTGDGKLVGGINGEKVWIELNPQLRNNNMQLNGTLMGDSIAGQWTWITYNGIANQGMFRAARK